MACYCFAILNSVWAVDDKYRQHGGLGSLVTKFPDVLQHILMGIGNSVHLNMLYRRAVSSVVEQRTHNPLVGEFKSPMAYQFFDFNN